MDKLLTIKQRIEEIDSIIDLCNSSSDSDILENLSLELNTLILQLDGIK